MTKPIYLPPGHDPTQIERPTERPGCLRYFVIAAFIVGGCMGAALVSFATSAAASNSHPTATVESPRPTATPTAQPIAANSIKPSKHPTPTPSAAPPTAAATTESATCWHRVQPGDTLLGITARYGASAWAIIRANKIANSNLIYAGALLQWPCKATATASPATPTPISPTQVATALPMTQPHISRRNE